MSRFTPALALAFSVGLFIAGCSGGLPGLQNSPEVPSTATRTEARIGAQQAAQGEGSVRFLGIQPRDPDALVEAVRSGEWRAFWNGIAWDKSSPKLQFDGQVTMWGVLVEDGVRTTSFLTDSQDLSGDALAKGGPSNVFEVPENPFPTPGHWQPGSEWVPGEELNPGRSLPSVASFFSGNEWAPVPGDCDSCVLGPNPRSWGVNFVVDGILDRKGQPGGEGSAQLLIIPVVTAADGPARVDRHGPYRTAGIIVRFEPTD